MSIQELLIKFKSFDRYSDVILVCVVVLTGLSGYSLGRVSSINSVAGSPIDHEIRNQSIDSSKDDPSDVGAIRSTQYVGSKNGSKYHLLWCPGAKQIKEENKIYFDSPEAAKKAGYEPASNCKGI